MNSGKLTTALTAILLLSAASGREFVTHTQTEPGRTIRVRVAVEPLTYNAAGRSRHDRA